MNTPGWGSLCFGSRSWLLSTCNTVQVDMWSAQVDKPKITSCTSSWDGPYFSSGGWHSVRSRRFTRLHNFTSPASIHIHKALYTHFKILSRMWTWYMLWRIMQYYAWRSASEDKDEIMSTIPTWLVFCQFEQLQEYSVSNKLWQLHSKFMRNSHKNYDKLKTTQYQHCRIQILYDKLTILYDMKLYKMVHWLPAIQAYAKYLEYSIMTCQKTYVLERRIHLRRGFCFGSGTPVFNSSKDPKMTSLHKANVVEIHHKRMTIIYIQLQALVRPKCDFTRSRDIRSSGATDF